MKRIQKAYAGRFRSRLRCFGARKLDQGVARLFAQAHRRHREHGVSLIEALVEVDAQLQQKGARMRPSTWSGPGPKPIVFPRHRHAAAGSVPRFLCDAGLGGLARWLRAAGYETAWESGIDDAALVRRAASTAAHLLTTDSLLMERRVIRHGEVVALWLPPALKPQAQLNLVFREFGLRLLDPRCMGCGGTVVRVDKGVVWDRIPPRTRLWLDDYFVCERCDRLFWHGTHWRRIRATLATLS